MLNQSLDSKIENEISFNNVIKFFVDSFAVILTASLIGGLFAILYAMVAPNKYEAIAQIQVAQMMGLGNSTSNIQIINVEDPNLVIARIKMPTTYDKSTVLICGFDGQTGDSESLAKMVKLSLIKATQILELKVSGNSRERAIECAQAIFFNIKQSQEEVAKPILAEATAKLSLYLNRLDEARKFINKADMSGSSMSAAYLSTRDDIKNLSNEVIYLNNLISSAETRKAKLISPIYSPNNKISPRPLFLTLAGLFSGFLLGVVSMVVIQLMNKYRHDIN